MIGGASWESTVLYYTLINQKVRERRGGLSSAQIIINSINYAPIVDLERQDKWDEVGERLFPVRNNMHDSIT